MKKEKAAVKEPKIQWAISSEWLAKNNRSLQGLAREYLCPKCTTQLTKKKKLESLDAIISSLQSCCSHGPDFINDRQPIMESIFRIFLINGNQPLDLEEMGKQVIDFRRGDSYRSSPEILAHVLENDRYYGIKRFPGI
jgi:hypothetical protein